MLIDLMRTQVCTKNIRIHVKMLIHTFLCNLTVSIKFPIRSNRGFTPVWIKNVISSFLMLKDVHLFFNPEYDHSDCQSNTCITMLSFYVPISISSFSYNLQSSYRAYILNVICPYIMGHLYLRKRWNFKMNET